MLSKRPEEGKESADACGMIYKATKIYNSAATRRLAWKRMENAQA